MTGGLSEERNEALRAIADALLVVAAAIRDAQGATRDDYELASDDDA